MSKIFGTRVVGILGALNGLVLGCMVEASTHALVWYLNRRMRYVAKGANEFINPVEYPPNWWTTPLVFMLVFTVASVIVHRFWLNSPPSIHRLWQKVGFLGTTSLFAYALAYDLFVRGVFSPGTVALYAILFAVAACYNYLFGMFARMVADYVALGRKASLP
jgi:hypothetical protein